MREINQKIMGKYWLLFLVVTLAAIIGIYLGTQREEKLPITRPYCSPKYNATEILSIAQECISQNYANYVVKNSRLTGCSDGISTFTVDIYKNETYIGSISISGDIEEVNLLKEWIKEAVEDLIGKKK
jgi:uncharacterized protein (UPF0333 family)